MSESDGAVDRDGVTNVAPTDAEAPDQGADAASGEIAAAAPASEPKSTASSGPLANPEVPLPVPPLAPPDDVSGSPWARPSTFTPPAVWDQSGYAPPPAIRLDDQAAAGVFAPIGIHPGIVPVSAGVAPVAPAAPSEVRSPRFGRIQLRTSLTILLFIAGIALGVVLLRLALPTQTNKADFFPALIRTSVEPIPAGAVAQELAQNDVHGLAQLLDGDTLTAIQTQLKPLVSFESVTFVGATSRNTTHSRPTSSAARDQDGTLGLVGLVIRLRDGQVVAQ